VCFTSSRHPGKEAVGRAGRSVRINKSLIGPRRDIVPAFDSRSLPWAASDRSGLATTGPTIPFATVNRIGTSPPPE